MALGAGLGCSGCAGFLVCVRPMLRPSMSAKSRTAMTAMNQQSLEESHLRPLRPRGDIPLSGASLDSLSVTKEDVEWLCEYALLGIHGSSSRSETILATSPTITRSCGNSNNKRLIGDRRASYI